MSQRPAPKQSFKLTLYSVVIEDRAGEYHEIVLPGRNLPHAIEAAEILFTACGPKPFQPMNLMPPAGSLRSEYAASASKLLNHLFEAYTAVYNTGPDRKAMAKLYDSLEYQIDRAAAFSSPSQEKLKRFKQQRAARALPPQVTEAPPINPDVANPFQPASSLTKRHAKAAADLSRQALNDAHEVKDYLERARAEHIKARKAISRHARSRSNHVRAAINHDFAPLWKQLRAVEAEARDPSLSREQSTSVGAKIRRARASLIRYHQHSLREALAPEKEAKQKALRSNDERYRSHTRTQHHLDRWSKEFQQQQWRGLVSAHHRAARGNETTPQTHKPTYLDRIAARSRLRTRPTLAPDQNNDPEPEM